MSDFYFDSERVLNPKCAFSLSKQCKLCCPGVKNGAKAIRCASSIQMSVIIASAILWTCLSWEATAAPFQLPGFQSPFANSRFHNGAFQSLKKSPLFYPVYFPTWQFGHKAIEKLIFFDFLDCF